VAGLSGLEVTNGDSEHHLERASWRITPGLRSRNQHALGGPLNSATVRVERAPLVGTALDRAILCARVAEDNKARDILVLDMRGITPLYDYFILSTGISRRQIHTIAEETDAALRAEGEARLSIEGYEASRWVVQDYGDIVVHVFDADTRSYYALEDLWADAPRIDWERG
jgi:ribosome-associated protein